MSVIEPAARAAFLDGGWPAVLALAGGAVKVALFSAGVECSSGGYARQTIDALSLATNTAGGSYKDAETVTFTPTGGGFAYDQVKLYARNGTTLLMTGDVGSSFSVTGEAHNLTVQTQIPASAAIACNTAAQIQTGLTNQKTSRARVRLAAANIPVTSTITMVDGVGGWLEGEGGSEPFDPFFDSLTTRLRWAGTRGVADYTPLLRYELGRGHISHIAFDGATVAQMEAGSVDKAGIGLLMRRANSVEYSGVGTGKALADDLYFSYFKKAMLLAEAYLDSNCDECTWRDLEFSRNDIAVELSGLQTMGHHFWYPRFGDNPIIFNVKAGGDVTLTNALMAGRGNVLFNVPSGTAANFGQNNGSFSTLGRLKIDSQATTCKLVSMYPTTGAGYYLDFDLQGVHFPSPQHSSGTEVKFWGGQATWNGASWDDTSAPALACDISGNTCVRLTATRNLQRGMLGWNTGTQGVTRYIVRDARVYFHPSEAVTDVRELADVDKDFSSGKCHFTFENVYCYDTQDPMAPGDPLPDWTGYLN